MNNRSPSLISAAEIASLVGFSHVTARNLLQSGVFGKPVLISTSKKRKHYRVSRTDFHKWFDREYPKLPLIDEDV